MAIDNIVTIPFPAVVAGQTLNSNSNLVAPSAATIVLESCVLVCTTAVDANMTAPPVISLYVGAIKIANVNVTTGTLTYGIQASNPVGTVKQFAGVAGVSASTMSYTVARGDIIKLNVDTAATSSGTAAGSWQGSIVLNLQSATV